MLEPLRYELIEDATIVEFAVLCESALLEANGTLSVIRIINRMYPPYPDMPYVSRRIDLALLLIQGRTDPDLQTIRLDLLSPDGVRQEGARNEFAFPDGQRTMPQVFVVDFTGDQNGVYWFEIWLNNRLRKRLPLQVLIPAVEPPVATGNESEFAADAE